MLIRLECNGRIYVRGIAFIGEVSREIYILVFLNLRRKVRP